MIQFLISIIQYLIMDVIDQDIVEAVADLGLELRVCRVKISIFNSVFGSI